MKNVYFIPISILILSCSTFQLPQHNNIPEDFLGIVHAGEKNTVEEYKLLEELGAKWTLKDFSWRIIEKEKDIFDFSVLDVFVDQANLNGIKIIGLLVYENSWLFPDNKPIKYISSENLPFFLRYVEETVSHFKGRVNAWQIWNEPNWIYWKGSAKEFYELTARAAQKIKEIDPDTIVIGGAFLRTPVKFIIKMHKEGAMENLDGLAFHPYALNPTGSMRLYDKFSHIATKIKFTGPIWLTELGYPTGGWYPTRVSLKKQPSYVIKAIAGSAIRGARATLWYQLFDRNNKGEISRFTESSEKFFGLAYPDYQRKDGAWAYQLCAEYLPGSTYMGDYPIRVNIPKSIVSLCFLKDPPGNSTLILWNNGIGKLKINLNLSDPAFIYNISTGEKYPLLENPILIISDTPLFISWQGNGIPHLTKK